MNRYVIYCTPGQTKKAIKLGAPIILESEYYTPTENDIKLDSPIPCESYTCGYHYAKCPTTEQMINWLEEQSITEISITKCSFVSKFWGFGVYSDEGCIAENTKDFNSREEATLAALDAALDYLIENKKEEIENE